MAEVALPTLGFIGFGLMGQPMVKRLVDAGFSVTVWNRDSSKNGRVQALGATAVESISEVVQSADIVILCVSDTAAVRHVVFGKGGIASCMTAEQCLLGFSSIDPEETRQMADEISAKTGAQWVDAPVSGGVVGATAGTLAMFVGGDVAVVDKLRPVLTPLASVITHMGPIGSGQVTKVCNQIIVSANVLVIAEVLALAEKAGIDSRKIPTALAGGFADSAPLQITGRRMAANDFAEVKWHIRTLAKDLVLAKKLTASLGHSAPMLGRAHELLTDYCDSGFAELDPATLIEKYRKKP